jgi:hypothetical protein
VISAVLPCKGLSSCSGMSGFYRYKFIFIRYTKKSLLPATQAI